jgi:magnesium transporter
VDVGSALSFAYMQRHPEAAAAICESMDAEDVARVLAAIEPGVAGSVLARMAPGHATACLLALAPGQAAAMLATLPVHTAGILLRRLPSGNRASCLAALPRQAAQPLARLLTFPENTAGALVDPLVIALPADMAAGDALTRVRESPDAVDHEIFVVDRDQVLVGSIELRNLIAAGAADRLQSLAVPVAARFLAGTDAHSIAASPAWSATHTVPVVDTAGVYLGAVRYDTILPLASADERRSPATQALDTLLAFGELTWSGGGTVLIELGTALPSAGADARRR